MTPVCLGVCGGESLVELLLPGWAGLAELGWLGWSQVAGVDLVGGPPQRPETDPGKRPVREIVGVDPALNERWSARRVLIKVRQGELSGRFQRDHGRPPTPVEAVQLAQQATLETRDAKHEPRTLAEQRTTWHTQAAETLGAPDAIQAMITRALNPTSVPSPVVDAD